MKRIRKNQLLVLVPETDAELAAVSQTELRRRLLATAPLTIVELRYGEARQPACHESRHHVLSVDLETRQTKTSSTNADHCPCNF
jgi:hypothetical protein